MFRAGDQIGPYILISKIGRGAFGVVWLAERRTTITTTKVALKMPLDEEIGLDAIRQEANLWVQASGHPNVLPIIEANVYDDQIVIVSEYAPDGSLDAWMKQYGSERQSIEVAVEMASGILAGLHHLHSRRIIHRDLKPQNILLQGQTPRLADFGISRVLKSTSQSSIVAGTPVYMAPEAFDGKRNEQTDLWSVGVMIYQMVAGQLPFPQTDLTSLMGAILKRNPDPLPISVPKPLQDVIHRALTRDLSLRYKSATEMRSALRSAMDSIQQGQNATRDQRGEWDNVPPLPSSQPKKSRAKVWVSTLAGILVVGILVANKIATHYWGSIEHALSAGPSPPAEETSIVIKNSGADLRRWLAMLGRWDDVPEVIRQTGAELASNPKNALALRARCAAYYLTHEEDAMKRDAKEIEQLLTNATTAEEYEARCYSRRQLKKTDEASSDCTRAIELDPQYAWARLTRASVYYDKKDYGSSIADYNKGIDENPSFSLAYNGRGTCYYARQEFDTAAADFNKAIELDPHVAPAYVNLGNVHYARQDYDGALADYNKAIEIDPRYAIAYANRGLTHNTRRDFDDAAADCSKAIEIDSRYAPAYFNRGMAYYYKKEYDLVLADQTKAIQLDPKNADAYFYRGNAYFVKQDYDHALTDYNMTTQLNPRDADAYYNRGNVYYARQDYGKAIVDYTKAIEINPRFGVAYGNRANAFEKTGDSERAAVDREKAQELK